MFTRTAQPTLEILMECYCVYSRVMNLIVIGQYTINIPEIFQVFTVF